MAAADVQSHLLDFIETQVTAALTLDTESKITQAWTTAEYRDIAHDELTILWDGRSRSRLNNETDLVSHRIRVEVTTKGESRETKGQQLSLWASQIENALGDRASSRSPIKSDATLQSTLAALNAVVFSVEIGDVSTTSSKVEGAFRNGVTVALTVIVQQRSN